MTSRQYCPFHTDDDVLGERLEGEGGYVFTCDRSTGHPEPGPHRWLEAPEPPGLTELSGLAEELGLRTELPAIVARYAGRWVEYGVVEAAYAEANPRDFAFLVDRYGHTAIAATRYSVTSFLGGTLGRLAKSGNVLLRVSPGTGRWDYNRQFSWWAVPPVPPEDAGLSWRDLGRPMAYVPGSTEVCPLGRCATTSASECPHLRRR